MPSLKLHSVRVWGCITGILVAVAIGLLAAAFLMTGLTVQGLLTENKRLQDSIARLSHEDQIGYAKVVRQEEREGVIFTTMKFVETARDDKLMRLVEKEFTIEGDVIYFDALIVKFQSGLVADGRERAMYLWRRVYGEMMAPDDGFPIGTPGREPDRYRDLMGKLSLKERNLFWSEIWGLANDPNRLRQYGIQAVFGNAVYSRLRPGLIYVFTINPLGQVYPEVIPEM